MSLASYIGIPYLAKGRMIDALDCWGLCLIYSEFELNKQLPQYMYDLDNEFDETVSTLTDAIGLGGRWRKVDDPKHGDILLFRVLGAPIHCGIYLENGDFLHTLKGRSSCIENVNNMEWNKRLLGIYRFNG